MEKLSGIALPPLLRRLYLQVGNGGFGPGYGLLGLRGGHTLDGGNALRAMQAHRTPQPVPAEGPRVPLHICDWGCAILSILDLADGQVWGFDPNPVPEGVSPLFPQHITITEWFARWLDGCLYQPWMLQDPDTGRCRGAIGTDYAGLFETTG
ncbi:hypothetical protein [Micromonospora sp. RTP1Z1]|uniref:hypothetical protein n=1 Tax=Micromonospora sp. RTP1Z1 TaxID=2994043 RepID=UPI0029C8DC94|nr:hypothetical protein [Micromonospora sp. RTP1Z1]